MTLDEYEKVKEEKRKALLALKAEERKVEIDKELQSMQQLSLKKGNDEVFIMLVSSLLHFSLSFPTVLIMVSKVRHDYFRVILLGLREGGSEKERKC